MGGGIVWLAKIDSIPLENQSIFFISPVEDQNSGGRSSVIQLWKRVGQQSWNEFYYPN